MINFLHSFSPSPVLLDLGAIRVYWYGLIMAAAMAVSIFAAVRIGRKSGIKEDDIYDLSLLLIIAGLIGARAYDVILEHSYYAEYPSEIIKIWKGGLAIHGAIIAGLAALIIFARKKKIGFFKLSTAVVPALAIGQAIGRFGNYFNQELFGRPTSLPWGIPIDLANRPEGFEAFTYFHPTFLYESLGLVLISAFLIAWGRKKSRQGAESIFPVAFYMLSYSLLRFSLEFIKIDSTPVVLGLRWPQIMSLLMAAGAIGLIIMRKHATHEKKQVQS